LSCCRLGVAGNASGVDEFGNVDIAELLVYDAALTKQVYLVV
jgi:hypothetical protein